MRSALSQREALDQHTHHVARSSRNDEFWYRVAADGKAYITRCHPASSHVSIPDSLDGYEVRGLDSAAFSNLMSVRTITCPSCMRCIGERAFERCMDLNRIDLNEGLESIGEEAFAQCWSLPSLTLPETVKTLGPNLVGTLSTKWRLGETVVNVSPCSQHLISDEANVIYARSPFGLTLVDGSRFKGEELSVHAHTTSIGPRAFASNVSVRKITLNEGLTSIGEEAFCGCTRLQEVAIPESLEEIGAAAFSCTAITSLYLPARCTRVEPLALTTAPMIAVANNTASRSSLTDIRVSPENPLFRLESAVLCRRLENGTWEAVLCPRSPKNVTLPSAVQSVGPATFLGTAHIGTLHIHESLTYAGSGSFLPHHTCDRLVIDLNEPAGSTREGVWDGAWEGVRDGACEGAWKSVRRSGTRRIDLRMPKGDAGRKVLEAAFAEGRVDVGSLLSAYDKALVDLKADLEKMRLAAARLAAPVALAAEAREALTQSVLDNFEALCVHFGARNYWQGFDELMSAGVMDERTTSQAIELLTAAKDTTAVSYLLAAKRRTFGKARWDFDL